LKEKMRSIDQFFFVLCTIYPHRNNLPTTE
jgi:hypothetical protein